MILAFAWITGILLAGKKTCTRRQWSDAACGGTRNETIPPPKLWLSAFEQGRLVHQALDKTPLVKNAKKVADVKLTQSPHQEPLTDMTGSDLDAEGGLWTSKEDFINLFVSLNIVV